MPDNEIQSPTPLLIVEDDPNDVFLIERSLKGVPGPLSIHVARDGEEALSYLSGTGEFKDRGLHPLPRLMLLDIKLPRKSGLEVLEWIKSQPVLRRIPVVMLTSSSQTRDITRAYDLGVNSYLVKPVNLPALEEILRAWGTYWTAYNRTCERP